MEQSDKEEAKFEGTPKFEDDSNIFATYYKPLAARTRKRQWRELASLRAFALDQGIAINNLATDASSWSKITSELIWAYVMRLKEQHYTDSSISMQLHTIKTYARLAKESNELPIDEYIQIKNFQIRPESGGDLRRGEKRSKYLDLTDEQVQQLLAQPDTQRGLSDKLLLSLLLFCGLWPREIAALDRHSIDLKVGNLTFYDYSAEEQQTLLLDPVTLEVAGLYLQLPSPHESLFVGNRKDSTHTQRLTDRAINDRIRALGKIIGIELLAPQDCHAYWEKHVNKKQHPKRKQRPDIFNRRAFEESMQQNRIAESMVAPIVSDSRLILPWAVEFIYRQESLREVFLEYIQQKLPEYGLKANNIPFYEEVLEQLAIWMNHELEKYRTSRS